MGPARLPGRMTLAAYVLFLVAGGLAACVEAPPPAEPSNAVLYVSNQSFDQPVAEITVWIDGDVAYANDQPVEDQHRWDTTDLPLAPGVHQLRAWEAKEGVSSSTEFRIPDDVHMLVQYWTDPPRFSVDFSDQQFMFD